MRTVLPLLLTAVALWAWDRSSPPLAEPVAQHAPAAKTRLVVLLVDSLDARDVSAMRLLSQRAKAGLHGPVQACVDAITLPCITALLTGQDRSSPIAPLRNFGAQSSLVPVSVLGALQRAGVRVGYFGEPQTSHALSGLARNEVLSADRQVVQQGLTEFSKHGLSVLILHLMGIDEAAHKYTERSNEYAQARAQMDALVDEVARQLPADVHLTVLGDHGHETSGRHVTGLGGETYAAYLGPRFTRALARPLVITDHASLWAGLFGLSWGEPSWVERYFAGAALDAPARRTGVSTRRLAWLWLLPLCALAIVLLRTPRHVEPDLSRAGLVLPCSVLLICAWPLLQTWGGPVLPLLGAAALLLRAVRGASTSSRWLLLAAAALCVSLALADVQHYLLRSLPLLQHDWPGAPLLPALLWLLALAPIRGWRWPVWAAGVGMACTLGHVPDAVFIAPCAAALPLALLALTNQRWTPLACLVLPTACWFFVGGQAALLTPLCAVWLLWSWSPRLLGQLGHGMGGCVLLLLIWASFWSCMGTRIGGVDFDFYFRWLDARADATSQLLPQAACTCAKYLLAPVVGMLLAQQQGTLPLRTFARAEQLAATRIALCIGYLGGLTLGQADDDVARAGDAAQELLFWLLVLASTGLVSLGARLKRSAKPTCTTRGQPEPCAAARTAKTAPRTSRPGGGAGGA